MEVRRTLVDRPVFSICIPQYNRTSFLIEACRFLAAQTFTAFEVCISDDRSTDGREGELLAYLQRAGLSFVYARQAANRRYDGNLRSSIALARGEFCFLLGNDDALAHPTTLQELYAQVQRFARPGVVITNYEDAKTAVRFQRVRQTGIAGRGPQAAVSSFRNFSFLGGIVLDRAKAQHYATDRWDGSEMYQMYLGCRIIASGAPLLTIDQVTVRQGIRVPGEEVDSYASPPRLQPCPIVERTLPMVQIARLVADAIAPFVDPTEQQRSVELIARQLFMFTYPFWIVEYRRVQSRRYALGVCLGMRPRNVLDGLPLAWTRRARLATVYALTSLGGLTVPMALFDRFQRRLYGIAKRIG